MDVEAGSHAVLFEFIVDFGEASAGFFDALGGVAHFFGEGGDDGVFAPDGFVVIDGFLEFVIGESGDADVGSGTGEFEVLESLEDLVGGVVEVARELDAFVAHVGDLFDGAEEVLGGGFSEGVELDGDFHLRHGLVLPFLVSKCKVGRWFSGKF